MLKLGYKASAEQFGPRELLEFSCLAEEVGFELGLRQRPLSAVEAHRRACAVLVRLARRARRQDHGGCRSAPASQRRPSAIIPRSWRRPSARSARCFRTGSMLRRRHRRVAERGAGDRHQMAGLQGAAGPAARGDRLMRRLWTEDRVTFEGQYYRTRGATIYDRPATGADLDRRLGPDRGGDGRRDRRGVHLHQRQGRRALSRTLLPKVDEGLATRRPPRQHHRADDRGQGLVRHRSGTRRWRTRGIGRPSP